MRNDNQELMTQNQRRLRLLSFNIQTGIRTHGFHDYVMHSWKHVLPNSKRMATLNRIARLLTSYDIVGLQEVDAGSLRSHFIDQTEYLAMNAEFPHWYEVTNRNFGKFARHSMGLLSRYPAIQLDTHRLPGLIPGRSMMVVRFGNEKSSLTVIVVHLALVKRTRMSQIEYIAEIARQSDHVVLMGDMNFASNSEEMAWLQSNTDLCEPESSVLTFPSWAPKRDIDHILVTPELQVNRVATLDCRLSDHLPIEVDITLPEAIAFEGPDKLVNMNYRQLIAKAS